jgi:hypothetical protein
MRRSRAKFLAAAHADCRATQHAVLKDLLRLNQGSDFSRDHQLSGSTSLTEFRNQIPVAD